MAKSVTLPGQNAALISVERTLDFRSAAELKTICQAQIRAGVPNLILDFGGTEFVDSTGLGVLMTLYKQTSACGGWIALTGVKSAVEAMLRLTRIDKILPQYPSPLAACLDHN